MRRRPSRSIGPKATPKPTPKATPKPTPKPTQPPKATPTPRPNATPTTHPTKPTAPPNGKPTPRPGATATPRLDLTPPAVTTLAPLPWLPTGSGPCTTVPFRPTETIDFETSATGTIEYNGERQVAPVSTHSGRMALASTFDDFGSSGHPIRVSFVAYQQPRSVAVFVGRDAASVGKGRSRPC